MLLPFLQYDRSIAMLADRFGINFLFLAEVRAGVEIGCGVALGF